MMTNTEELIKAKQLFEEGILTEYEFSVLKAQYLGTEIPPSPEEIQAKKEAEERERLEREEAEERERLEKEEAERKAREEAEQKRQRRFEKACELLAKQKISCHEEALDILNGLGDWGDAAEKACVAKVELAKMRKAARPRRIALTTISAAILAILLVLGLNIDSITHNAKDCEAYESAQAFWENGELYSAQTYLEQISPFFYKHREVAERLHTLRTYSCIVDMTAPNMVFKSTSSVSNYAAIWVDRVYYHGQVTPSIFGWKDFGDGKKIAGDAWNPGTTASVKAFFVDTNRLSVLILFSGLKVYGHYSMDPGRVELKQVDDSASFYLESDWADGYTFSTKTVSGNYITVTITDSTIEFTYKVAKRTSDTKDMPKSESHAVLYLN